MSLARPLIVQWLATAYVAGFSMLMTFFIGRSLGPEIFGKYSYLITLASLFAILQDGGFRTLLFREFTSPSLPDKAERLFPIALGHLLAVTALGVSLILVFPFAEKISLLLAVCAFGLGTATHFISSAMKGMGNFSREAGWRILVRSLTGGGIIALLFLAAFEIEWVFTGWIVGVLVSLFFQRTPFLEKIAIAKPDPIIYKSVAALLTIEVATMIYFKIDIVMLRHMEGALDQLGFYAASSRMLEGIMLVLFPFANVFFRELRRHADHPPQFMRLTYQLLAYAGILSLCIVPMGMFFGDDIILLCFGPGYQPGSGLLYWLILSLFFMIPNLVLTQGALAINRENHYALGACLAALLNMALNYYLIPLHGARGAAIGTLVTEAFLLIYLASGIHSWCRKRKIDDSQ